MKLTVESIDFARNHIEFNYDSDFFPNADYFKEIWDVWDKVKDYLLNTDIADFEVFPKKIIEAPKHNGGFRLVHQLEPLNVIVYTAITYLIVKNPVFLNKLEINVSSDGNFIDNKLKCSSFNKELTRLSQKYAYTFQTDIKDFTNSIFIYKLKNVIEKNNPLMKDIAGELTAFLIKINSGITQGLPTGPFVTSILADILMTDVDEFIKNKNFEVIRYMDDIRVYSDNKEELQSFKEELHSYLEKEHKLCLSPTKTRIFKNSEFHESENIKLLNEEII